MIPERARRYVLEKGDKAKDDERIAPNYDKMIGDLVAARHEACSAKDTFNELSLTFAEGFVAFVASAPEADAGPDAEKYYARCADAIQSYWHLREELARTTADESELAPPCGIGDVAALECCAHSLMQLRRAGQARPFFEAYVEKADQAGPLMAYGAASNSSDARRRRDCTIRAAPAAASRPADDPRGARGRVATRGRSARRLRPRRDPRTIRAAPAVTPRRASNGAGTTTCRTRSCYSGASRRCRTRTGA